MTGKIVDPTHPLQNGDGKHAQHGAERKHRVKTAIARDHFVQPGQRAGLETDMAVQQRAGDPKRVVKMLLHRLCREVKSERCKQREADCDPKALDPLLLRYLGRHHQPHLSRFGQIDHFEKVGRHANLRNHQAEQGLSAL